MLGGQHLLQFTVLVHLHHDVRAADEFTVDVQLRNRRPGFADAAADSATSGSPLADYQAGFLDGALGRSVAGILGVLVTLVVFYGLARLLRRREPTR